MNRVRLYAGVTRLESDPPELLLTVMFCGFVGQENVLRYWPPPMFFSVPMSWSVAVTNT